MSDPGMVKRTGVFLFSGYKAQVTGYRNIAASSLYPVAWNQKRSNCFKRLTWNSIWFDY